MQHFWCSSRWRRRCPRWTWLHNYNILFSVLPDLVDVGDVLDGVEDRIRIRGFCVWPDPDGRGNVLGVLEDTIIRHGFCVRPEWFNFVFSYLFWTLPLTYHRTPPSTLRPGRRREWFNFVFLFQFWILQLRNSKCFPQCLHLNLSSLDTIITRTRGDRTEKHFCVVFYSNGSPGKHEYFKGWPTR